MFVINMIFRQSERAIVLEELGVMPALSRGWEIFRANLGTIILMAIILGVIDLANHKVETPEIVAERIRRALPHIDPTRIILAPDCGMKYLPRDVAFGKMRAMVEGAAIVRREVTGEA